MKCPTDGATLVMSERSGVEIDYCPDCRGIWLDRGELDKILDRAAGEFDAPRQARAVDDDRHDDRSSSYSGKPYRKKKKENWLMDLFD